MPVTSKLSNVRLLVSNFDACLYFYTDVMGFKLPPGHGFPYVEFDLETSYVALFDRSFMAAAIGSSDLPAAPAQPTQDHVALIFEVDDVDQAYAQLQAKGAEFVAPPTDRAEWGIRTAHLRDPDGNLIELFHGLPPAANHP